ncbi:MAG: cysteine-rich CWC family protein [Deltaproteobacteria bacterium]|nr:cysteine-rich CWC family protein [Deltaproteobacteria bacterium]
MTRPIDTNDATRCPLCGAANECAMASGRPPESCWCMTATMDPAALAAIPAEAQGKVCICARCASGARPPD